MDKKTVSEKQLQKMKRGLHILTISYRVAIILGLVSFVVVSIITLFLLKFILWLWIISAAMIVVGVLLAWAEYRLYHHIYWE